MNQFGPEAYFVHIPSRFSPDNADGTGFMAMAANFAEGSRLQSGGCGARTALSTTSAQWVGCNIRLGQHQTRATSD